MAVIELTCLSSEGEFIVKILNIDNNRYPYPEMARVGITEDNMDIIIRTDDPGKIPHFCIVDRDNPDSRNNEGCVKILEAEYFNHGNKQMVLNSKQRKILNRFLLQSPDQGVFDTNWDLIVYSWNINNSDTIIPDDAIMPDYTKLR